MVDASSDPRDASPTPRDASPTPRDAGPRRDARDADAGDADTPAPDSGPFLPGVDPPPESELEPGSPADLLYSFCWYFAALSCEGSERCCDDPRRDLSVRLGDECTSVLADATCRPYLERPDAFGEGVLVDEELVREQLERLRSALDECAVFDQLAKPFFGMLGPGDECGGVGLSYDIFCRDALVCAQDEADAFVCTEPGRLGDPCGPGCQAGLRCAEDGRCGDLLAVGEPCADDFDCATYRCGDGVAGEPEVCLDRTPEDISWCFVISIE